MVDERIEALRHEQRVDSRPEHAGTRDQQGLVDGTDRDETEVHGQENGDDQRSDDGEPVDCAEGAGKPAQIESSDIETRPQRHRGTTPIPTCSGPTALPTIR